MSEKLIVSPYENNYGGAVKRLNLIDEQPADLDYAKAQGFLINGLKREQLIAMNSMILHELFFDGLGDEGEPGVLLKDAIALAFGSFERWRSEFIDMGEALGGRLRVGAPVLVISGPEARQSMGRRSLPHTGGRHADPCARYVRALLEPHAYLTHLFTHLPAASTVDDFEALLPWNENRIVSQIPRQLINSPTSQLTLADVVATISAPAITSSKRCR
jgi:superoxide dismutase, Fe-Mn family